MIDGIDHVSLPTENLEAMLAFYRGLGLAIIGEDEWRSGRGRSVALSAGGSRIHLHPPETWKSTSGMRADEAVPGCGDICFRTRGTVADARALLRRIGARVVHGPASRSGARGEGVSIYTRDPDRNLVELIAYGDGDVSNRGPVASPSSAAGCEPPSGTALPSTAGELLRPSPSEGDPHRCRIEVPAAVLEDLHRRLMDMRWPDEIQGAGWGYGTKGAYLRGLVDHWLHRYDWRDQERVLNGFANNRCVVDGVGLHYLHLRGRGPNPVPLLLLHGWPSTFAEMVKVIGPLTDPARFGGHTNDSFDVVVPSLPGFGFSDRPTQPGMNVRAISALLSRLMGRVLGYRAYGLHGGDWGSVIAHWMSHAEPSEVIGLSVTQLLGRRVGRRDAGAARRPVASHAVLNRHSPQTMSFALNDSPVGLASWIIEKYATWGDPGDGVRTFEDVFTKDELLTAIMIYWVSQSSASSARLYLEDARSPSHLPRDRRIEVPTGVLLPADSRAEQTGHEANYADIRRWTVRTDAGHFVALEQPAALVNELRQFFRPLR